MPTNTPFEASEASADGTADPARDGLAGMLDWAPGFICILKGPRHVVEYVNRTHRHLFHSADWVGKPAREAIPEITAQGFHDILDEVYRSGERFVGSDLPVRYRPAPGAPEVTLYHDFVYEPIRGPDGQVAGIFCEGLDVTAAHVAREELARHVVRQEFRLDFERTVAMGGSPARTMADAARLIAERWAASSLVLTERIQGTGTRVCRRSYRAADGQFDEEARPDFPFDAADMAVLAAGGRIVRTATRGDGGAAWEIVVPRRVAGKLAATAEVSTRSEECAGDDEVALLEEVARRLWEEIDRLRMEAERERFFDASIDLLCIASLDDGRIRRASRSFRDILGRDPGDLVGMASMDLVHPDDRRTAEEMAPTLAQGGHLRGYEQRVSHGDGSYRWISWSTTPVPEENLIFGVGRDVTERREFDRQRDVFIAELNHRVKNTLAVVQAMASQTFRAERTDPGRAIEAYQNRISALAAAHDLLTDNNWGPVGLGDVVARAAARGDRRQSRISADGPDLRLSPRQAIALSLALNELLANATAHGALRAPEGRVDVTWTLGEDRRFEFLWREEGAAQPVAPARGGFGTQLLAALGDEFDGTSDSSVGAGGYLFRLMGRAGG